MNCWVLELIDQVRFTPKRSSTLFRDNSADLVGWPTNCSS